MSKKSLLWSKQEDLLLKSLRQYQNDKKFISWETIAKIINTQFDVRKTSTQSRTRYFSYMKFKEISSQTNWSTDELKLLFQLYKVHGSSWTIINSYFNNKSQNAIKNRFNNSIKKVARMLNQHQFSKTTHKKHKRQISFELLKSMMELTSRICKMSQNYQISIHNNSIIAKFRTNVIKLSINNFDQNNQQIYELLQIIRQINKKTRTYGHFKAKNKKGWKMSLKNFYSLSQLCQKQWSFQIDQNKYNSKSLGFSSNERRISALALDYFDLNDINNLTIQSKNTQQKQQSLIEDAKYILGPQTFEGGQQFYHLIL